MWFHYQNDMPGEVGGLINLDNVLEISAFAAVSPEDTGDEVSCTSILRFEMCNGTTREVYYNSGIGATAEFRCLVEAMDNVYEGDSSEIDGWE